MSTVRPNSWVAVDPALDRVQQARRMRRVHDAFHAGENVCTAVRRVVGQSWGRSGDAGLRPDQLPPLLLGEDEVDDRWRRHPLSAVRPVLREVLAGPDHLMVISDAAGVILWVEGDQRLLLATEDRHVVCGADWSESAAGTNALGTTIAVGHPVQIFSAEHFSRVHHRWHAASAPIHDPRSGALLGVVGLTGDLRAAHPHTLALVSAAARMAESALGERARAREERLRDAYLERIAGKRRSTALVARDGRTLLDVPRRWAPRSVPIPPGGGEVLMSGGQTLTAEPLARGGYILWGPSRAEGGSGDRAPEAGLELELLGRAPAATVAGERLSLKLRHAELLALLLLDGQGLSADELALEIYGSFGKAVTVRAELSRLRRALGGVLQARPYRLIGGVRTDLVELRDVVATADPQWLLDRYRGPLLPDSQVPRIASVRDELDADVRHRVLGSGDAAALARWCALPGREHDLAAAELLLGLLPDGDYRRGPLEARLDRPAAAGGIR
ncbi:MAG: GAF domain-containing protein [Patulibacter sp.]|nr:GAF domain-containing protein [Patulibacter sp.]